MVAKTCAVPVTWVDVHRGFAIGRDRPRLGRPAVLHQAGHQCDGPPDPVPFPEMLVGEHTLQSRQDQEVSFERDVGGVGVGERHLAGQALGAHRRIGKLAHDGHAGAGPADGCGLGRDEVDRVLDWRSFPDRT